MLHPALRTPLCDLLEIDVPIIQAGMGFVARGPLAAAVSAAGGLGVIGSASLGTKGLREEIHRVRDLTDRPFGVDILFATIGRPERNEAEARFTRDTTALIDIVFEEEVPVIASGLGNPAPIVPQAHELGMKVLALVGNTKNAVRVARSGVDVVIAQGYDGGGHTGRVGTMTLLPAVLDCVDVPVMAAGGIADGRGLAAVLAMGGVGAWLGTRFIATHEAWGHQNYKERILAIDDEGTIRTRCFSGKPCRVIKNDVTAAWEDHDLEQKIKPFPLQFGVISEWLGKDPYIQGRRDGHTDIGALAAGQSSVLIRDIRPAGDVLRRIAEEASEALERLVPSGTRAHAEARAVGEAGR
ncbi:MAG: nitronate monooxygenase [Myxococcota bacterium]